MPVAMTSPIVTDSYLPNHRSAPGSGITMPKVRLCEPSLDSGEAIVPWGLVIVVVLREAVICGWRQLLADFVAEVPIEIGEGRRCGPLLPLAPAGAAAVTL
jgi:hypothetical protein